MTTNETFNMMKNATLNLLDRRLFAAFLLLFSLSIGNSWGGSSYYSALKGTATPSGQGKVYVAESSAVTDEETSETIYLPAENDPSSSAEEYTGKSGDAGSGGAAYLTAYAIPKRGYIFSAWSDLAGDGSPELYNCALTDNPIQVKVIASTSGNGTNTATIKANFATNPVSSWNAQYLSATNGSYTVHYETAGATQPTIGGAAVETYNTDLITLTATPASGYVFYRYYGIDSDDNKYTLGELATPSQTITLPDGTVKIGAEFTNHAFIAGESTYPNLKDAIQALRKNDGTYGGLILLLQNYTVPAGYYTIPAGVTLLIPYKAGQTPQTLIERTFNKDYVKPSQFSKLTLASGVHMDVFGTIETGCKQSAKGQSDAANGAPTGPYGHLYLESGSDITIESGAILRAWGFVTGEGTIDVRRGGEVHEQFQILDFKGGTNTSNMCGGLSAMSAGTSHNEGDVFPLNQFFIQNVECRTTYHPGAKLFCSTAWYMSMSLQADDIQLVGVRNHKDGSADDVAMFLMDDEDDSDDTWICKYYDRATDRQMYEVNNSAAIGSFVITMEGRIFPTANFDMPITSNMTIHLLNGKMDLTQDAVLLAGAEIILDKQSTFIVPEGVNLYLYDQAEWDKFVFSGFYAQRVKYVPHLNGAPTARAEGGSKTVKPASAAIKVGGTMQIEGAVYTTASGANITSTNEEAGTILFNKNGAPAETSKVCQWNSAYVYQDCPSAILRNGDGSDWPTAGTPAGQSFCYINGKWTSMTVDKDSSCFVYDNYGTYYAKPADYVAINATKDPSTKVISGNTDHTYSDAAGEGKLYILVDDCQWWEVVNEDNLYHCKHPQNNTYYWWNNARMVGGQLKPGWEEKKFAISWKDYDGSPILDANNNPVVYYLPYGATPKYLSTNPTRPADVDYTYNFTGWSPAFAPVTGDQSYTATYSKEQIKYTIIFKFVDSYHDGAEIERQQLVRDEMPVVPTIKRTGYYLKWTPAIGAVTGNATYEADWMEELPDNYTITWKNYDGSTLSMTTPARDATAETVLAGAPTNPTKPATSEYRYEFAGWQPTVAAATADAVYTAQYTEIGQTYAIRFYKEDGTTQIGETQNLMFGAAPSAPASTKENTVQYTFTRQWKDMSNDVIVGVGVPSVSGDADYKEYFTHTTNRYTISANSEVEGEDGNVAGCTFTGVGTYDYDTDITLTAIPNTGYEFVKWKDNDSTDPAREISVSETTSTYTAIVKPIELTVEIDAQKTIALPTTLAGLTISSNGDEQSSEVLGAENLSFVDGRSAYFDLQIGDTEPRHWHAFSVPFQVNLKKAGKPIQINGEPLTLGRGYDILFYDGAERAAHGKTDDCWIYVEDGDSTLYPGKAYMIASASRAINTVRFTAELDANGKLILADGLTVTAGSGTDGGWNGIGNPNMYHSTINVGPTFGYVHDGGKIGEDGYVEYNINKLKYVVGKAVYVQVEGSGTQPVVVNKAGDQGVIQPNLAPARRSASAKTNAQYLLLDDYYKISLSNDNGIKGSNVYVLDEKDKENKYVIGHDLAKMSMSNTRAQIWVERYNDKLSLNTTAPIDNQANYPLGIYAPKAGEYTISMPTQIESGKALYLTLDGEAIWNLSDGAYTISLEKGTTNHYGLRISAKAPQMPTDIDEAVVDAKGETQKVLIDNQVFIIRGNEAYTITGKKVN